MILDDILNHKRREVAERKEIEPVELLKKRLGESLTIRPLQQLITENTFSLIAEVKKASPSKGLLCPNFDPVRLADCYETTGATAISVLTDERFFQGSLDYLRQIKAHTRKTPLLRKDFIIDPYQILEAKVYGADAILLIVAALTPLELQNLLQQAADYCLDVLVEVHDAREAEIAVTAGAKLIGINNRDLQTFKVSLETTYQLLKLIPKNIPVVSESGIHNRNDITGLIQAGVKAVLVGESLVTAPDPAVKIRELLGVAS